MQFAYIFTLLITTILLSAQTFAESKVTHQAVVIKNTAALPDAEFSLKIDDIVVPYSIFSVFVLPNEKIEFEVLYSQSDSGYVLKDIDKEFKAKSKNRWLWRAPQEPGAYKLMIESANGDEKMQINAFVKVPSERVEGGKLKYFHIGHYPNEAELEGKEHYIVPDGYIEVTEKNKNMQVSPHFKLKEFISKQRSKFPKYVYLKGQLLLKLEKIRKEMTLEGYPVSNMVVMSGYRTPYYNKSIGNVKFSRHVFGDAADVFIDNNGNYRMDDLNNDGKFTIADADVMADVVESLSKRDSFKGLMGGLGVYGPKSHRGAFIHIDTRGFKARWRKP
ncbi:hypothetical protein C7Y70_02095 [Pseudoalteromonas sp. KS88]|uniref:D-Ala-D-Ala carboxypeptidase family metallohydrolase n=1 Tax=Pseudoalteromonas sp. KS88 TaxID=2109918 RepID=UPI0010801AFC|nr:D-Ala-D-Ala carboxypeptidase family metallohydrolase [Pseudoalteromonas sp. KS88]TGE85522.1 hypothetical protein C7Y70_02095 [Pseudoalteromonas sp. KS88]